MRTIIWLLLVLLAEGTCFVAEGNTVIGSGKVITQDRKIPVFSALELQGAFTAEIICQKEVSFKIQGDDNIVEIVRSEVDNGKLRVFSTKSYTTNSPLHLMIGVPSLSAVEVSGANTVNVSKVKGNKLLLQMGGSATFSVSGEIGQLKAILTGGSTLHADDLVAERVSIDISGAGDADVHATGKLDVKVTGVGNVTYKGNPEVTRSILGVGEVSPR